MVYWLQTYDSWLWLFNWCAHDYLFISGSTKTLTEHDLLENLLDDYHIYVRPVRDPLQIVEVYVGLAMQQILDLVSLDYWILWEWQHNLVIKLETVGISASLDIYVNCCKSIYMLNHLISYRLTIYIYIVVHVVTIMHNDNGFTCPVMAN